MGPGAAVLLVVLAPVLLVAGHKALAETATGAHGLRRGAAAADARLNPTGRDISFDVPLRVDGAYLGEVTVTITPRDAVLADRQSLERLIVPLMTPEAAGAIFPRGEGLTVVTKTSAPALAGHAKPLTRRVVSFFADSEAEPSLPGAARGNEPGAAPHTPAQHNAPAEPQMVPLSDVAARGLAIRYDEGSGELHVATTIDQRPVRSLSFGAPATTPPEEAAQEPARLSGFINTRAAIAHISQSLHAKTGFAPPSFDFDAAIRVHGVVFESEASFDIREETGALPHRHHVFRRHGSRLVYDDPAEVVRYKAGDIYPGFAGYQTSPDMLGVSAERSYAKLRPQTSVRATSETSFRIERASSVDILVDEIVVRRIRLSPGNYNVRDLPLRPGANRVKLVVQEDTGFTRTLDFTLISSQTLLAPGLDEWEFAAGFRADRSRAVDRAESGTIASYSEPAYDFDDPLGTLFYRIGATPFLTVEAHAQAARDIAMAGGGFLAETEIGLFGLDFAASVSGSHGAGFAIGAVYDTRWGARPGQAGRSLKLSADYLSPDFAGLAYGHGARNGVSLAGLFTSALGGGATASLSASYRNAFSNADDASWNADLTLSRTLWDGVSASVSAGYAERDGLDGNDCDCALYDESGFRAFLRLSYRPDAGSHLSLSYDAGQNKARAAYSRTAGSGPGAWTMTADATYGADDDVGEAGVTGSYIANRAEFGASHASRVNGVSLADGRFKPVSEDQRTTVRMETGLAFADGAWAVGRPVRGGFAIVEPHEALGGAQPDITAGKTTLAQADDLGPALLSDLPPYMPRHVTFEVADLPLGYDLGADGARFLAPYKAGHRVTVGNGYNVTAIGTLLDADGVPLALVAGKAVQDTAGEARSVELFTNRSGRFGAQGLAPGAWIIVMPGTHGELRYRLDVPKSAEGYVKAGTLRPQP